MPNSDGSNARAMHLRLCQFGGAFLFASVVGTAFLMSATARLDAVADWPSVTGRVIGSEAEWGVTRIGRTPRVQRMADVRYAYVVNGQRFECDALRVLPMLHFSDGTPEEICARYPVGMAVAVYYDPEDPADALLVPEPEEDVRSFVRAFTLLSVFLGFLGVVMVVSGVMHLRAGERAARAAAVEARRAGAPPALPPMTTSAAVPVPVVLSGSAAAPTRPAHWLLRLAGTLLGLFLLMMGGLLAVTAARTPNTHGDAVRITCYVLFAGMALGGGYMVTRGTRRPTAG